MPSIADILRRHNDAAHEVYLTHLVDKQQAQEQLKRAMTKPVAPLNNESPKLATSEVEGGGL